MAPHEYVLEHLGKNPTEPHILANYHVSKPGLVWWVLQNSYSLIVSKKEHRMVCVPAGYLTKLREKALAELAAQADSEDPEVPFISEGDCLLAWVTRLAMANLSEDSEKIVSDQSCYMANHWKTVC